MPGDSGEQVLVLLLVLILVLVLVLVLPLVLLVLVLVPQAALVACRRRKRMIVEDGGDKVAFIRPAPTRVEEEEEELEGVDSSLEEPTRDPR